jgi:hypothetical protein
MTEILFTCPFDMWAENLPYLGSFMTTITKAIESDQVEGEEGRDV